MQTVKSSVFTLDKKQGRFFKIKDILEGKRYKLSETDFKFLTYGDMVYRALCAILYNYAPLSGHPGGSISSGRIVAGLVYNNMAYDFSKPDRQDNDLLSYAAGHKALGLYAMSALRDEIVKTYSPQLLADVSRRLRLEDLLGFRHSLASDTKLFKQFNCKSLDGHPVPVTPFVKLSTGASGVGAAASAGLALGAAVAYGKDAPRVNVIEGEGGLTAGRVAESLAAAATAGLDNLIFHLDWNQASIESDKVTAEGGLRGDYTCWTPAELFYINGFNVIEVQDGFDFEQVCAAQKFANELETAQPTAIIYRTVKGWHYGIEGKASHGSGHKFASEGFYHTLNEFEKTFGFSFPRFCGEKTPDAVEECFWHSLEAVRKAVSENESIFGAGALKIEEAKNKLESLKRKPIQGAKPQEVYTAFTPEDIPLEFSYKAGDSVALRNAAADALAYINKKTDGALLVSTADLGGSTCAAAIAKPFASGFYNKHTNPQSKLVAGGGICEDGLSCMQSGVSAFGMQLGVAASYAAFTAPMMHTAARLHAIGQQSYSEVTGKAKNTFIVFSAHASLPTGEDGATHADAQALQLIEANFPRGAAIVLAPLDGASLWPLLTAALQKRPAVIYPVVTRPAVKVFERPFGVAASSGGVEVLHRAKKQKPDGVIVLQGSGAGEIFLDNVLPELKKEGFDITVYYVASRELFDMLPEEEREKIMPSCDRKIAIAITDFTLPVMECWLKSDDGVRFSLYPFKGGKYLSSGKPQDVYKEASLDAGGQIKHIKEYLAAVKSKDWK